MEVIGSIRKIENTQDVSASFRKRSLILTTEEQYPQHLNIEFVQDKTALLDNFREGEKVKVAINLRGREWTSPQGEVKYFNSINGWRIDRVTESNTGGGSYQAEPQTTQAPPSPASMPPLDASSDDDDLPF